MRKSISVRAIQDTYFNKGLDIRVQSYNALALMGILAGVLVAAFEAATRANAAIIIPCLLLSAMGIVMLRVAERRKCYRLCSWIVVAAAFMIAFPIMFFSFGGYRSGMPCFLVLALFFTSILLDKHSRTAALLVELILYITCCLTAYYYPETVYHFPSEFRFMWDVVFSIVLSGTLLLMVVLLYSQMYRISQLQTKELIRELTIRSETLEQYDHMKSDFLATVAHEINTPLAVISASSCDSLDLLKETPLKIDEIKANQEVIVRRIKLISSIIIDLMDAVAIENGRLPLNRDHINITELIKDVCDNQFSRLDNNNNRITYKLQTGLEQIWADPMRVEQLIINLLSNAVEHTEGGEIKIVLEQTDKGQTVSVIDNGEGMEPDMAHRALKRYASEKVDYWRHGIGLFTCHLIVLAHGGKIWIDSEKGRGTSITFYLREQNDDE